VCGYEAIVKRLLENSNGQTLPLLAADCGIKLMMKQLLEKGATPLSWAVTSGHEAVVKLLLEEGAELESKSSSGMTPLLWAIMCGHEAVVKPLLDKGAELDSKGTAGRTPLTLAAFLGREAVVKLLPESQDDPETGTLYSKCAL
jgi:ankyrin repeat protein